jgi:hypothetical protein
VTRRLFRIATKLFNCLFTSGTTPDQPVKKTLFFYQRLISALSAPYILGTLVANHSPT